MKLGDVIVAIEGRPVVDSAAALNAIAGVSPGKSVPVRVLRRNQDVSLEVMVGKRRPRPRAEE
jgi:serine protease DegQ